MKTIYRLVILVIVLSSAAGCATTWTYGEQQYETSEQALEAARMDMQRNVDSVPRRDRPIAGSLIVYTPSLAWSRQTVVTTGNASEEQILYVASVMYHGFYGMGEAVQRSGLFTSTQIREFSSTNPIEHSESDYLLWLQLDGPDKLQWMISRGNDTSSATRIFTLADPNERVIRFVEDVEQYVSTRSE